LLFRAHIAPILSCHSAHRTDTQKGASMAAIPRLTNMKLAI
jgi:hypothetical protein